jgi:predicted RNA binding protein YcfA (HicA-like mRNA interferase family)
MKTLILSIKYPSHNSYYDDWLDAFMRSCFFKTDFFNIFPKGSHRQLKHIINEYDLVILLHSCLADTLLYVENIKNILKDRKNKLFSFVGNEYNHPSIFLSDRIDFLKDIKADFIGTQLPLQAGKWLYEEIGSLVIATPHALNAEIFKPTIPFLQRTIDIGVRSSKYPPLLGDDDRNRIYDYFKDLPDLKIDFNQTKRFSRTQWVGFLNQCKATVSTEAGSFYLERDDATVKKIKDYILSRHKGLIISPDSSLRRFVSSMPIFVKDIIKAILKKGPIRHRAFMDLGLDPQDVYQRFFQNRNKCPYPSKALSSRHFDAIGTKTVQIMFEGHFNGILIQDEHYISLKNDFSNIEEVLEKFKDTDFCQKMVDETYDFALEHHTYEKRLQTLFETIIKAF